MQEQDHEDDPADDAHPQQDARPQQDAHLTDVEDGCGCTEVWEHLSEHRDDD